VRGREADSGGSDRVSAGDGTCISSLGCHNKALQTRRPKTKEIYSLKYWRPEKNN